MHFMFNNYECLKVYRYTCLLNMHFEYVFIMNKAYKAIFQSNLKRGH